MRKSIIPFFLVCVLVMASLSSLPIQPDLTLDSKLNPSSTEEDNSTSIGWSTSFGGGLRDYVAHSLMYPDGGIVTSGWFQGNIQFDDVIDPVGARGGSEDVDFFLGWTEPNGTWITAVSEGSITTDSIDAIALMPNGDLIVAGTYCMNSIGIVCELELGDLTPLTKNSYLEEGNAFLARMDTSREWVWATQIRNENELFVLDMLVTPENNIELAVGFNGDVELNRTLLEASTDQSLLVASFSENGESLSYVKTDSIGGIVPKGSLCIDGSGATYVTVTFTGELFVNETVLTSNGYSDVAVARYSEFGWDWALLAGGPNEDRVWDCDGMSTSGIEIVGEYNGNASFGPLTTGQSNETDLFVAEISQSGGWVGVVTAGGVGIDRATGIAHNKQGSTFVTGMTSAGLTLGQDTLIDIDGFNDENHYDIFLAELLDDNTWEWAVSAGGDGYDQPTALEIAGDGSPFMSYIFNGDFSTGQYNATSLGSFDVGVWHYQTDRDNDGVLDGEDNCPRISNMAQSNFDEDIKGDVCDEDDDNDGVLDATDDCQFGERNWFSEDSTDHDGDGCRDATEDFDDDEDTVFDHVDLCPLGPVGWKSTAEVDAEGDGCADIDTDGDDWVDQMDNCPFLSNPTQVDLDGDNIGDGCDIDEDGDKIANPTDNCPRDSPVWTSNQINDHDQDGCHDSITDFDDDEDGVLDALDSCPRGEIRWSDSALVDDYDGDGCRDTSEDDDDDSDGVNDLIDNCRTGILGIAAQGQDVDGDGCIDSDEDDDDDEDGVLDTNDLCPRTVAGQQVGITGCSQYQLDDDLDGIPNAIDLCQNTDSGRIVDLAGCQVDIGASSDDDASSESGFSLSNGLYALAIICVIGAVYVNFFNNPNSSKPAKKYSTTSHDSASMATPIESGNEQEE
jgi:hypothetical protein